MATEVSIETCPRCNGELVQGFLGTEQMSGLVFGPKCSKVFWCEEFRMGFFGSPKGEDVSGRNTQRRYMAIPAVRCMSCRILMFEY